MHWRTRKGHPLSSPVEQQQQRIVIAEEIATNQVIREIGQPERTQWWAEEHEVFIVVELWVEREVTIRRCKSDDWVGEVNQRPRSVKIIIGFEITAVHLYRWSCANEEAVCIEKCNTLEGDSAQRLSHHYHLGLDETKAGWSSLSCDKIERIPLISIFVHRNIRSVEDDARCSPVDHIFVLFHLIISGDVVRMGWRFTNRSEKRLKMMSSSGGGWRGATVESNWMIHSKGCIETVRRREVAVTIVRTVGVRE